MAEIKAGRYEAARGLPASPSTRSAPDEPGPAAQVADDLKGRTVVTPDPDSITAAMVRAMFAHRMPARAAAADEQSPTEVRLIATRYQDAVPFYIENGFAEVGATAAKGVVKAWTDKGGKVFARSRAVPIKQFIVSTRLPADQQQRLRDALLNMRDAKPGREALDTTGYKGFVAPAPDVETATIAWLGL